MLAVSLYEDTYSKNFVNVSAVAVAKNILLGKWEEKITALRMMSEEDYKKNKLLLPAVTWSGTFQKGTRLIDTVESYNGLIVIDIDNIDEEKIQVLKSQLSQDEYVCIVFESPSGKGIKIVFTTDVTDPKNHRAGFLHLQEYVESTYFVKVDPSGKDVCRLCFVSSDRKAIIKESNLFQVDLKYGVIVSSVVAADAGTYAKNELDNSTFELCMKWVERTKTYVVGERNTYIHALACALNRCGIPMDRVVTAMQQRFTDIDPKEIYSCCRSAYFHNQKEHGTVQVKDTATQSFIAPAYIANYTDDVAENDLMRVTATLYHQKVPIGDIMDIVSKIGKYYEREGYIDLRRSNLFELMNKAVKTLQTNVANSAAQNALKYETAEELGREIVKLDLVKGLVKTFIPTVDRDLYGGLMPSNFYELIGLGGTYKSILTQFMAYKNAMNDVPVLYLNGEMSSFQFYGRLALMAMNVNLRQLVYDKELNEGNIDNFIEQLKSKVKNNIFVVNGNGFNQKNVYSTLQHIEATTGKKIRLIIVDGITQMDSMGKEEVMATIHNSGVCKEIAKETGAVVVGLLHMSGDAGSLTLRDTGKKVRGGIKTTANSDGYFSTSKLIDPNSKTLENPDEIEYLQNKFYLRLTDKRTETGICSYIINVSSDLHLHYEDTSPQSYEFNPHKR